MFALKQQRPANLWEFYICLEITSRMNDFPNMVIICKPKPQFSSHMIIISFCALSLFRSMHLCR